MLVRTREHLGVVAGGLGQLLGALRDLLVGLGQTLHGLRQLLLSLLQSLLLRLRTVTMQEAQQLSTAASIKRECCCQRMTAVMVTVGRLPS